MLDFSLHLPQSGGVMEFFFREAGRKLDQLRSRVQRVGSIPSESQARPA
jgi:hypothetical protein